jgi:hypothetical protein
LATIGKIAKIKKALDVLPKRISTPSFIKIAQQAVTKRALLTEDDGRHVIAIAHQGRAKQKKTKRKTPSHITADGEKEMIAN